jgi:signal transduction histidine kinase
MPDLKSLLRRFLGESGAKRALKTYFRTNRRLSDDGMTADAGLLSHAERLLAGTIGSASARVMVNTILKEKPPGIDEVMNILDETRQAIAYSHELEKTTAELKRANERLKELDRLKDDFISTVTHELKTPLTSVRSLTEILHDHPELEEKQRKNFLQIIVKETERLTRLITQVLDFQKIDADGVEWHMQPLNLGDVISDSIAAVRQLTQDRQIALSVDIPESVIKVRGDHDRLVQVMMNLVSNAAKFCPPEKGRIHISLETRAKNLLVSVRDNGIGISRRDQKEIFEKFKQVKSKDAGRPPGTGLGLSIAKKIVEYHNGEIWVESKPGKGATFKFTIPAQHSM